MSRPPGYGSYWSKPEKRMILRVSISDTIGNELSPGMIVAYSSGAKLKFGVYEGVAKIGELNNARYRILLCTANNNIIRRNVIGKISFDKKSKEFSSPENLVVVKNPLYHLGNHSVASCLMAIDRLKDEKILPDDFKAR